MWWEKGVSVSADTRILGFFLLQNDVEIKTEKKTKEKSFLKRIEIIYAILYMIMKSSMKIVSFFFFLLSTISLNDNIFYW